MRFFVFFLYLWISMFASVHLYGQSRASSPHDAILYTLVKAGHSPTLSFIGDQDTIHFEAMKKVKKSDEPAPFLKITENGNSYNVITYFSGFGYHISTIPDDSLMITYGDMPYGELIVNGLPKMDQANNSLNVDRLNCVVSINGVRGEPTLDLGGNTLDTEKLKKLPIKEILVTNNQGDKVFCGAAKEYSNALQTSICRLRFNEANSNELNERLKISMLFIFWLYEKAADDR